MVPWMYWQNGISFKTEGIGTSRRRVSCCISHSIVVAPYEQQFCSEFESKSRITAQKRQKKRKRGNEKIRTSRNTCTKQMAYETRTFCISSKNESQKSRNCASKSFRGCCTKSSKRLEKKERRMGKTYENESQGSRQTSKRI